MQSTRCSSARRCPDEDVSGHGSDGAVRDGAGRDSGDVAGGALGVRERSVFGIVGVAVLVVAGCVVIANAVGRALDYVNREEVVMSVSKRENNDATV